MPDESKLATAQQSLVAAWDERRRLFEAMRNPNLTDEQRQQLQQDYKKASREFDRQKTDFMK